MRLTKLIVVILAICSALCMAPQTLKAQSTLNNDAVIKLVKAGLSEDLIISTINSQPGTYDTSTDGLIALKSAGISDKVVNAIISRNSAHETTVQDSKKIQEPEFKGIIAFLDPSGAFVPLERQTPKFAMKTKAMGWGGMKQSNTYSGSKSPVRFKEGQDIRFVVRYPNVYMPGIEPRPDILFTLNVLKTSSDAREIVTMKLGAGLAFASAKSTVLDETQRKMNFSKYGEVSILMSPEKPLEPGEYVMKCGGSFEDFLFGIDPK